MDWYSLSSDPYIIDFIQKDVENIKWIEYRELLKNPIIFELDYDALKKHCSIYAEELIQKAMHPSRYQKYLDDGYELDEIDIY